MNDWTSIYITGNPHHAEMMKQVLEDNGIIAVIINKKDSSYLFGDIEVYVNDGDAELAKHYIKQFKESLNIE